MARVRFDTTLEEALLKKLKILAIERDVNVNELLEKMITEYLEKDQNNLNNIKSNITK